jgi:hypothetical protein
MGCGARRNFCFDNSIMAVSDVIEIDTLLEALNVAAAELLAESQ